VLHFQPWPPVGAGDVTDVGEVVRSGLRRREAPSHGFDDRTIIGLAHHEPFAIRISDVALMEYELAFKIRPATEPTLPSGG
jgi:hypothetical protein